MLVTLGAATRSRDPVAVRQLPTGTVTFLFTDIEGSTRLLEEVGGEAYAVALGEHRRVLRGAFARHGGVEVDTEGDAFFVAFTRASDGVAAAAEAQDALGGGTVRVRMGLHTGEPLLVGDNYVGIDVHRAARVMAAGHGGQVLLSEQTARMLDGVHLRDLGEHRLKDLAAPVRLFQVGPEQFPPLKTLHSTNLPVQPTPLIGRERELAEAGELLKEHRFLTLTGPGGTGKTRLALQLAAEAVEDYPDGVWWVPLQALRDPLLVLPTIAQVLGAQEDLPAYIASKRLLVLLDNVEQLIDCAPELAALLAACPNLKLLTTSRERLQLSGEHEYSVLPLEEADAVALFNERALAVQGDFVANGDVASICRCLDYLPLAIELAAARVKVLSPHGLLERLDRRLPLLIGGARDLPERQRTLRSTIAWSYELLAPDEQRAFAHLAVFAGGWTLDAADEVCEAPLDILQSLLEKSLVRRSDDRFWMLETIREYALERLEQSGEADALRARHAEHFLALAESTCSKLGGRDEAKLLNRMEADHDNLRSAFAWSIANDRLGFAASLAAALWRFWHEHTHFTEGRAALNEVLARRAELTAGVKAEVLMGSALLSRDQGALEESEALYEELIHTCRLYGDETRLASALGGLGVLAVYRGEFDRAAELLEQSLERRRMHGDKRSIANALNDLGIVEVERDHLDRAGELFAECLAIQRRLGSTQGLAFVLHSSACLALRQGRTDESAASFREGLRYFVEIGDQMGAAHCIEGLGSVAAANEDVERAAKLWGAGEALRAAIGAEIDPNEQTIRAPLAAAAHRRLGTDLFAGHWRAGAAMTLEEAVGDALASVD
jgi:predicted ATPase/class 3 adenylate cyclase